MTFRTYPLARIAWALTGLSFGVVGTSSLLPQKAIAAVEIYGAGQCLTQSQVAAANNLVFPQSYSALTGVLGSPEAMDRHHDWHCVNDSYQYLVIRYNDDGRAIALGWSK